MSRNTRKFVPKKSAKPESGLGSSLALTMESYSLLLSIQPQRLATNSQSINEKVSECERNRAGETAQGVKGRAVLVTDLSSIPESHKEAEGENQVHTGARVLTHTYIQAVIFKT